MIGTNNSITILLMIISSFLSIKEQLVDAELDINTLNSAFFSKLRFETRHIQDQTEQCARFWEGIYRKLHSDDSEQILEQQNKIPLLERVNVDLLNKVNELLQSRKSGYGPSSLLEYNEACIEKLSNLNGNNLSAKIAELKPTATIKPTETPEVIIAENKNNNNELLAKAEEENNKLKEKFDNLQTKLNNELKLKNDFEIKNEILQKNNENCQNELNTTKLNLKSNNDNLLAQLEQANKDIEKLKNDSEKKSKEIELLREENDQFKSNLMNEKLISSQLTKNLQISNEKSIKLDEQLKKCQSNSKEISYFESTLNQNKIDLNKCNENLKQSRNIINELEQFKLKLSLSLDDCNRDLKVEKLAKEQSINEISKKDDEIKSIKSNLSTKDKSILSLKNYLTEKDSKLNNCKYELILIEKKIDNLESNKIDDNIVEEMEEENHELRVKVEMLQKRLLQFNHIDLNRIEINNKKVEGYDRLRNVLLGYYESGYQEFECYISELLNGYLQYS